MLLRCHTLARSLQGPGAAAAARAHISTGQLCHCALTAVLCVMLLARSMHSTACAARKDLELLELRERMREAQSSVSELAAEVATFKFQGEHYAAVFRESEELKAKLKEAEVGAQRVGRLARWPTDAKQGMERPGEAMWLRDWGWGHVAGNPACVGGDGLFLPEALRSGGL